MKRAGLGRDPAGCPPRRRRRPVPSLTASLPKQELDRRRGREPRVAEDRQELRKAGRSASSSFKLESERHYARAVVVQQGRPEKAKIESQIAVENGPSTCGAEAAGGWARSWSGTRGAGIDGAHDPAAQVTRGAAAARDHQSHPSRRPVSSEDVQELRCARVRERRVQDPEHALRDVKYDERPAAEGPGDEGARSRPSATSEPSPMRPGPETEPKDTKFTKKISGVLVRRTQMLRCRDLAVVASAALVAAPQETDSVQVRGTLRNHSASAHFPDRSPSSSS
jgi:hypothetical protein